MKLETTWNEHGKIWHYFTTSREAKAARIEGVVLNPARGVWRSIAGVRVQIVRNGNRYSHT